MPYQLSEEAVRKDIEYFEKKIRETKDGAGKERLKKILESLKEHLVDKEKHGR